jgi:hypothetical protein
MAPKLQPGRQALVAVVIAALVGTAGLMVAAMRTGSAGAHWPKFIGSWRHVEKSRTEEKTVPLGAAIRRLEIVSDGAVQVTPGAAGTLKVAATVHAFGATAEEATSNLQETGWQTVPAGGDTVKLEGNADTGMDMRINGQTFARHAYTDFVIQAPPGLTVVVRGDSGAVSVVGMAGADLETDSGRIEAAGLTGRLVAEADSGSLSIRDIRGDVQATTDSGSITAVNVTGEVKAEGGSGGIRVETADRATLRTDHGRVEARHVAHALKAETSTGGITAAHVGGGASLTSEHGSIDAREIRGGRLVARTETGAIDLDQPGVLDVDYDLRTEHGGIELALPKGVALTADLKTRHGRIDDALGLPPAATDDDHVGQSVAGKLGSGDHQLTVFSDTGSIEVRAAS